MESLLEMECAMMRLILLNAFMMEVIVVELVSMMAFAQSAHVMKKLNLQLTFHVCNINPKLIFNITQKIQLFYFKILRL